MRFQSARVAFCPQFVQIVSKAKKVKLCENVRPAPSKKALELAGVLQYTESTLYPDGTVDEA